MTSWANASGRILVWVVVVLLVVTGGKQSQLLLQLKLSWVCKLEWSLTKKCKIMESKEIQDFLKLENHT